MGGWLAGWLAGWVGKAISVRLMLAGGLSQSCKRMSIVTEPLLTFIAGKMTPAMQLTDVAVAFLLKKIIEACKAELRRQKRGNKDFEAVAFEDNPKETKSGAEDLMRILGRSWKRMREQDEDEQPERLLKAAMMCGWLSYRADPARKVLIRRDEEGWMQGRAEELKEESQRHPFRLKTFVLVVFMLRLWLTPIATGPEQINLLHSKVKRLSCTSRSRH